MLCPQTKQKRNLFERIFGKKVIILDTRETLSGKSSTIIDPSGKEIKYIREGEIKFEKIKEFLK